MEKNEKNILLSARTLTKSNVWKLSENDIITIIENASKEIDIDTQFGKLINTIKCAFYFEELKDENTVERRALENRGFHFAEININGSMQMNVAIKKHAICRITDLTYQNIAHLSARRLLDLIESNFGGGWDSLSQSIKDVIQSGFLIATTSMPKSRKPEDSALYKKKIGEGFEVLAVEKGSWMELIFAKQKESIIKDDLFDDEEELAKKPKRKSLIIDGGDDDDEDLDNDDIDDDYSNSTDDEDEDYNDDELTAESYRTVVEEDPEDLDVNSIEDDEDY